MVDFFSVQLKKSSAKPLYLQLGDILSGFIKDGTLKPHTKLPPIRRMSKLLNVNVVTVVSAYKYLESQTMVYTREGSGTYVSGAVEPWSGGVGFGGGVDMTHSINFAHTSISAELFPCESFKKIFAEVLDRDRGTAFSNRDPLGEASLREGLVRIVANDHITAKVDNLQIIPSVLDGVEMIAALYLSAGDVVFVESPSTLLTTHLFLSRGIKVVEIPLNDNGMDMEVLYAMIKLHKPKLIYASPHHQVPTNCTYSMETKLALLDVAAKEHILIIEEDCLSHLHYGEEDIASLRSLDRQEVVVYIRCFSKFFLPDMNIGFIVYNDALMKKLADRKSKSLPQVDGFIQKGMDLFIRNQYEEHKRRLQAYYGQKYKTVLAYANQYLAAWCAPSAPGGGLAFWFKLFDETIAIDTVCDGLLRQGIILQPSHLFYRNHPAKPHLRVGFSNVTEEEIERGFSKIDYFFRAY